MKNKILLLVFLFAGITQLHSQTYVAKKNTQAFIDKYEGFYVEWVAGQYTYSWKWHFEVINEYQFQFKPEYKFNGKVDPYSGSDMFSFIPANKEQKYKSRKSDSNYIEKIVFFRKSMDGERWVEYVDIEILTADQAQFIKDLKLVYQDFGATLTEKTD